VIAGAREIAWYNKVLYPGDQESCASRREGNAWNKKLELLVGGGSLVTGKL
jgi:hypothetical protein